MTDAERDRKRQDALLGWADPEKRARRLAAHRAAMARPEVRMKIAARTKAAMARDDVRAKTRNNGKKSNPPATRKAKAERMKALWRDPEYRKNMQVAARRRCRNPNHVEKVSDAVAAAWKRRPWKNGAGRTVGEAERRDLSARSKAWWADPKMRRKMIVGRMKAMGCDAEKIRATADALKEVVKASRIVRKCLNCRKEFRPPTKFIYRCDSCRRRHTADE